MTNRGQKRIAMILDECFGDTGSVIRRVVSRSGVFMEGRDERERRASPNNYKAIYDD